MERLESALLRSHGFVHAFTTRVGGVSAGPFASANLARNVGDDPSAVEENHRRLAAALGVQGIHERSQVHGAAVAEVTPASRLEARVDEADALLARAAGLAVGVRVADCVPVLLADRASGAVAAVHAGWRGVEARIVTAALAALGAPAADVVAAIGPHIRVDRFEVGDEVASRLAALAPDDAVVDRARERPHVDLAAILRSELRRAGVASIDDVGGCTVSEPERFFSHRRDRGVSGRQMGVIVARGPR